VHDRQPAAAHCRLVPGSCVRACVMDELVADDRRVQATDEVEFLAPVSGG
jgi:molybdopterin converting factor small subunit